MSKEITPDYLIIGAGAMGMGFADVLLAETKATIAIVDRYARPGGHWTIAYPFVTLHQPSTLYGVASRRLGEDKIDQVGFNKGLMELATGDEICAYYSKVMHQTFLPTGRVTYYPKHEYLGNGAFNSIITNDIVRVGEATRIVDSTYMKVMVPSMRPPQYEVSEGVGVIAPNGLATLSRPYNAYTVVGAGKTGVDACLWLIANGIDPKKISWIMPRDSWFLDRSSFQPIDPLQEPVQKFADFDAALLNAESLEEIFLRYEECGFMLRIDRDIWPTMWRCATVSTLELEQLKRVGSIIRQGRVKRLSTIEVELESGSYKPVPDTLYIDCTADALAKLDPKPIFNGKHITLQSLRFCLQVYSAAVIGKIEATFDDDDVKNALCDVVPHPDQTTDFISTSLRTYRNRLKWLAEPKVATWLRDCRLDAPTSMVPQSTEAERSAHDWALTEGFCKKLESLISVE